MVISFKFFAFFVSLFFSKIDNNLTLKPGNTIIVVTKSYPIGVRFLYKWLNKIYNTEQVSNQNFSVLREFTELTNDKDTSGKIIISIGDNHFNKNDSTKNLPPYSFIIKRKGNLIIIKGGDDTGTNLGIAYFLNHYCGVKLYLPGDMFTSLPNGNQISLPKVIDIKQTPFTTYVSSTGFFGKATGSGNDITQWDSFWAIMNGLNRKNWNSHQHTMSTLFYDSSILKKYPEIYPLINGKRYFPTSSNDQNFEPDFADPHLVDASLSIIIKYFKKNPSIDYIAFSVMDGEGYSKEGEMGNFLMKYPKTADGYTRGYTDAYVKFLNNLASKLPIALSNNGIKQKKTIVYISYSLVRDIPKEKLNPAILPVTVYHLSNAIGDSTYTPRGGLINKWARITKKIGNDDWAEGMGFIYPKIYTGLIYQYLKSVRQNKLDFKFTHIEAYPNWGLDGPKFYEMGMLYLNPNINVDSMRSQFCIDMFGNGAKQMKNYFSLVEQISYWLNNHSGTPTHMFNYPEQLSLDSQRMIMVNQARKFLDEAARQKLTNDQMKRILFFSNSFKVSEGLFDIRNSKFIDTKKINEFKLFLKDSIAGNDRILYIAKDKNFLQGMYALIDNMVKMKKSE